MTDVVATQPKCAVPSQSSCPRADNLPVAQCDATGTYPSVSRARSVLEQLPADMLDCVLEFALFDAASLWNVSRAFELHSRRSPVWKMLLAFRFSHWASELFSKTMSTEVANICARIAVGDEHAHMPRHPGLHFLSVMTCGWPIFTDNIDPPVDRHINMSDVLHHCVDISRALERQMLLFQSKLSLNIRIMRTETDIRLTKQRIAVANTKLALLQRAVHRREIVDSSMSSVSVADLKAQRIDWHYVWTRSRETAAMQRARVREFMQWYTVFAKAAMTAQLLAIKWSGEELLAGNGTGSAIGGEPLATCSRVLAICEMYKSFTQSMKSLLSIADRLVEAAAALETYDSIVSV